MGLKTDKPRNELVLEAVVAQLRHAYAQLKDGRAENWTQRRRMMFADGLIAPQIKRLEELMQRITLRALSERCTKTVAVAEDEDD